MKKLFIRLPPCSRVAAAAVPCAFALCEDKGGIVLQGQRVLAELAPYVAQAQHVVLLLAASDVTLLPTTVPPLSPAKLKAALPYLIEDQLLCDPQDCVIAVGPRAEGTRLLAVTQRSWLEQLVNTLQGMGARSLRVLPAQLCLPYAPQLTTAAISGHDVPGELCIRLSPQQGLGLPTVAQTLAASAEETLAALRALLPQRLSNTVALRVPASQQAAYAEVLRQLAPGLAVLPDNWDDWIAGAAACPLDLATTLGSKVSGRSWNWQAWRRPLAWAAALLLLNVTALNLDWWRLSRQSQQLNASMREAYHQAYPRETIIVDPVAQVRQKILMSPQAGANMAPDDFVVLAAQFQAAWDKLGDKKGKAVIAALAYRDRSLFVRLANETDSLGLTVPMQAALAPRQLLLSQASAGLWRIRSQGAEK